MNVPDDNSTVSRSRRSTLVTEKLMDQPVHISKTAEDLEAERMVKEDRMYFPVEANDEAMAAKFRAQGISSFGIYEPDPNYLVEEAPDGTLHLVKDGERLKELQEDPKPASPKRKPLTLEAAKRIIRLDKARANNELEGVEQPEWEFQRMCELAREADSDEEFERMAMAEFEFNKSDPKETRV